LSRVKSLQLVAQIVLLWEVKMENRSTVTVGPRLDFLRCAATGTAVLASLFVFCWIGAAIGDLRFSHMFIQLFTTAPVGSVVALAQGACWALGFGAIMGALFAFFYNIFDFGRR
jgi:hypothetical protein